MADYQLERFGDAVVSMRWLDMNRIAEQIADRVNEMMDDGVPPDAQSLGAILTDMGQEICDEAEREKQERIQAQRSVQAAQNASKTP